MVITRLRAALRREWTRELKKGQIFAMVVAALHIIVGMLIFYILFMLPVQRPW